MDLTKSGMRTSLRRFNEWLLRTEDGMLKYIAQRTMIIVGMSQLLYKLPAMLSDQQRHYALTGLEFSDLIAFAPITLVHAPIVEGVLMVTLMGALGLVVRNPFWIVWITAFTWGVIHGGWAIPTTTFAFLIYAAAYLAWRRKGRLVGYLVSVAIHFLANFFVLAEKFFQHYATLPV
jgi:hypothetical protein